MGGGNLCIRLALPVAEAEEFLMALFAPCWFRASGRAVQVCSFHATDLTLNVLALILGLPDFTVTLVWLPLMP